MKKDAHAGLFQANAFKSRLQTLMPRLSYIVAKSPRAVVPKRGVMNPLFSVWLPQIMRA